MKAGSIGGSGGWRQRAQVPMAESQWAGPPALPWSARNRERPMPASSWFWPVGTGSATIRSQQVKLDLGRPHGSAQSAVSVW